METITIVNKSGKVVKTSKHLLSVFKDAKAAYQEKKAEIKAEIAAQREEKLAKKQAQLENTRHDDSRSVASSRRSHRTHRSHRTRDESEASGRPKTALTASNLDALTEASSSVAGSKYGNSQHGRSRPATSHRNGVYEHRQPASYYEDSYVSRPDGISRRHTDYPPSYQSEFDAPARPMVTVTPRYADDAPQQLQQLQRAMTSPAPADRYYDPHLAYGDLPPSMPGQHPLQQEQKEEELKGLMTKLDTLMVEARCVQHSANTIVDSLQKNPDAMAAVALTLAEVSNLVTKLGPGALAALKTGSPAIFALLCSPQFLIAGGVAVGVTIVMFGGYKIIKKIQKDIVDKKEAKAQAQGIEMAQQARAVESSNGQDEAIVFEDNYSIESWRRGITMVDETSVEGEYITPKADQLRKERIRQRQREERASTRDSSVASGSTVRRKPLPSYIDDDLRSERSGRTSKTSRTERTERTSKTSRTYRTEASDASTVKPDKKDKDKKVKKPNALVLMFKGSSVVTTKKKEKERGEPLLA